jgi:HSP20 family molecular chaperone IbpA
MNLTTQANLLKASLFVSLVVIGILLYFQLTQAKNIDTNNLNKLDTVLSDSDSNQILKKKPEVDMSGNNSQFNNIHEQINSVHEKIDQLMKQKLPRESIFSQHGFGLSTFSPIVSIDDKVNEYVAKVELPDGEEMEFHAEIIENTLKITGKTKSLKESETDNLIQKSFSSSQFFQSLLLAENIDETGMTIEQNKNVYIIKIPKK